MGDGLNVCAVCGDRYTQDSVCHVCRQQEMIDNSVPDAPIRFDDPEPLPEPDEEAPRERLRKQRADSAAQDDALGRTPETYEAYLERHVIRLDGLLALETVSHQSTSRALDEYANKFAAAEVDAAALRQALEVYANITTVMHSTWGEINEVDAGEAARKALASSNAGKVLLEDAKRMHTHLTAIRNIAAGHYGVPVSKRNPLGDAAMLHGAMNDIATQARLGLGEEPIAVTEGKDGSSGPDAAAPPLHVYEVGMASHVCKIEAPSAAAAAIYYGFFVANTNAPFMAAVYSEDGAAWTGDMHWLNLTPTEAWAIETVKRVGDEFAFCRVIEEPIEDAP